MVKQPELGRCALCQQVGPLTFEHFPPKSIGNKLPVITREWTDYVGDFLEPEKRSGGRVQQKGSGWHALCAECNNWQGRELVPEYQRWALPLRIVLDSSNGAAVTAMADAVVDESIFHMRMAGEFRPGRFARYALAAALLSTSRAEREPPWHEAAASLVRDGNAQDVPSNLPKLFMSICAGPLVGVMGVQVALSLESGSSTTWWCSSYGRPFAFWLVEGPVKPGMLDITEWLEMASDQVATSIEFSGLTFGFSHLPFPADLRSLAAIRSQAGEMPKPHPDYLGASPDRRGAGIQVTVEDRDRSTTAEIRIEVPGRWRKTSLPDQ